MLEPNLPRDWLETLPELDVPSAEEVQADVEFLSGADWPSRRYSVRADEWADFCED